MPRYHCLIPDRDGRRILAISAGQDRWTLPAFEHDGNWAHYAATAGGRSYWFAHAGIAIARAAAEHFGVAITVLRERSRGDCLVCELEVQGEEWVTPAGTRWIDGSDLAATNWEPAALTTVLGDWFIEQERGELPLLRPPWERRGWFAEARSWIENQCMRSGCSLCEPIEQLKAAWSLSTILRVKTEAGALYFKADIAKPPSEPRIIAALARRWPRNVPSLVAADHDRGWMLMRDFGSHALDTEPVARWQAANQTFAAIQIACSGDLEPWWGLGCPDLRIPALAGHMDRMFADPAALGAGEPGGLTETEAARLEKWAPRLQDMWNELGAIPIPASIVQQDFRHSNLVLSGETFVFYDWSDTVISHPFFAACRFLDYVQYSPELPDGLSLEVRKRRIADAYLEPWARIHGEKNVRRAFALTQSLNPLYVALRRYLDAPHCEPDSFWGRAMREGPAMELRRLLGSPSVTERI